MFNLFPQKKSVDELIGWNPPENVPSYIQAQDEMIGELLKENTKLKDALKSIEEDGTVEHNNAIKLREENVELKGELEIIELEFNLVLEINDDLNKKLNGLNHLKTENDRVILLENAVDRWSSRAESWEKLDEELKSNISELTKEVLNLRHLKTENVELIERLHKEIQKKGVSFNEAELQIIKNDYKKCAEQRDEYKHQLNASNKEIEALKSKIRDWEDRYTKSFSYRDMDKLQKTIDEQKKEIQKLKGDIVDYVIEKDDKLEEAKAVIEALKGMKTQGFEDYDPSDFVEQKHPMYPLHWGGYDKNIKEFVESELNNEDPVDGLSELLQKAKDLTEGVEVDLDKSLDEQCDEEPIDWNNLPKTFPNEFQDEETTAENLEEKFDRGEDVMDYFQETWKCPCNMCKQAREENTEKSWEETASDLALKVAKLEKKIEELTIITHTSDPNYKYFLEHGKWPYSDVNSDGTLKQTTAK